MKIEEYLKEVSSVKHIVDVPIDEFNTIDEITELIKRAKKMELELFFTMKQVIITAEL